LIDLALRSSGADPYRNLALEESLLERGRGAECLLFVYVDSPCLVIGRNQNPWAEASEGCELPVLRRVSGGGAVYHDGGNLNWSLLVPRALHDRDRELALVVRALRDLGVEAIEGPRGGLFLAGEGPYAGAKISGTARRIAFDRVLHHGTLLVDADLSRMRGSLGGIGVEASRALVSVGSPCANLASVLPGIGVDEVARSLARSLVGVAPEADWAGSAEKRADAPYAAEAERRLRGWEWTWGATPDFSVPAERDGLVIDVRGGRVVSIRGPGSEAAADFVGRKFDYGSRHAVAEATGGGGIPR
jgi:lipoate---protein ligase